ncbi:MAG: STAS domain-containing protein [Woeseia sp.]|nr:STAS domain-containing protein [Woeseia sp.]MBT8097136.1 STAS domain-containing protein [Woeseia sp.]NNE59295.1 STAS domain-containing protein [Woeseia sp.]NNL55190.1 STAS domain-containing protein [Woeseia sp.]
MSDFEFKDLGEGNFALSGVMGFATADQILKESESHFEEHTRLEVDLGGVTETDSAGLALLLEWITWANHTVREIRFKNTPEKITAIARTTEVEGLLKRGERWSGFIEAPTATEDVPAG